MFNFCENNQFQLWEKIKSAHQWLTIKSSGQATYVYINKYKLLYREEVKVKEKEAGRHKAVPEV